MTFGVEELDEFLLVGALVTLGAILAVRLSTRIGFPSLLIYLFIGMLLGESGLGIGFDDYQLAHALGFAALALILAEGGLTTSWKDMRPVLRLGMLLALVGVLVSTAVVAFLAHYLLGLNWQLAILLGAVCAPTDAAAVFSILRGLPLPKKLPTTLEAESGLNDAPTVVLVTVVASGAWAQHSFAWTIGVMGLELMVGAAIGLGVGFGGAWLMRRIALPASGLYPIAILLLTVIAYATAAELHASGFAAVYLAALVLGNQELPHRAATRSFVEGLAWVAQIGMFVMLGLLFSPDRISMSTVMVAIVAGVFLTFIARPISVLAVWPFERMPLREMVFISWAGLRGAVPIVMATIPLAAGVAGAEQLFDVVVVLVVVYTLVTGPTLPRVARALGVISDTDPRELTIEAAPMERLAADLLQINVSPPSRLHGVEVGELRLPRGASVALVIRGDVSIVPEPRFVLRHGDDLLIVTPRAQRRSTERRLRAISSGGRLAQWLDSD